LPRCQAFFLENIDEHTHLTPAFNYRTRAFNYHMLLAIERMLLNRTYAF